MESKRYRMIYLGVMTVLTLVLLWSAPVSAAGAEAGSTTAGSTAVSSTSTGSTSAGSEKAGSMVVGTTQETLSSDSGRGACSDESSLGDALADAVRTAAGADLAIVCGGDLDGAALPYGAQTEETIRAAVTCDQELARTEITPQELYAILEVGVSHITIDPKTTRILHEESSFYGFPQVSGITFLYDAGAPAGSRVLWIRQNGKELDRNDGTTKLTMAASAEMLSGGYGYPVKAASDLHLTLTEALQRSVAAGMTTNYAHENRMQIHGTVEDTLISHVPVGVLVLLVVLFAAGNGVLQMRKKEKDWDHNSRRDWGMY